MIGKQGGAVGSVYVDGPDSNWTCEGDLFIGEFGSGSLLVTNGASVLSADGYIGKSSLSVSKVEIDGSGSNWSTSECLYIGGTGSGHLSITRGSTVNTSLFGYIGYELGSSGQVVVSGKGSSWAVGPIYVGRRGDGLLRVTDGAVVTNTDGLIGMRWDTTSEVLVDGEGSTWISSRDVEIRYGALAITRGGLVQVEGELSFFEYATPRGFLNLSTGGQLALFGEAGDSMADFLDLVEGTDAIRYWSFELGDWAPITDAVAGDDYTLEYLTTGDLAGYTVLTVGTMPVAGDFNGDGLVDLADYTVWRDHLGAEDETAIGFAGDGLAGVDVGDYQVWKANFATGDAGEIPPAAVPEPSTAVLAAVALLLGARAWRRGGC
ncbi:PEP-CTERM sorting domain-containing protein [Aeoliella mucimassa]|nr:PEP-CTERM sorting domain-containing protein [Aeoliella mucimassa]